MRAVLPLMAGIAWQWYTQGSFLTSFLTGLLGLGGLLLVFVLPHRYRFRYGYLSILFQSILFFSVGSLLCTTADSRSRKNWIGHHLTENTQSVEILLKEDPVEKAHSYRIIAEAVSLQSIQGNIAVSGGLLLYLKKQSSIATLRPGDRILLHKIPERIRNAGNPGEFDQEQQWLLRGVTHSVYADSSQYLILKGAAKGYGLLRWISQLRHIILEKLQKHLHEPQVKGLAAALMIGYRQDLDPTLSQSYSNTGVIHIIAISGLHLALIGWMLEKLLQPFQKKRSGILLSQLILLSTIWLFSMLAEAAPSVLRAALLFSVQGLGAFLNRKGNSFNTLAAAAFLLLCYNPFWLWDLGFQLSFIAVLSILLTGRPLSRLFAHANYFIHSIGQLIAVSLAAQSLTTPLTLFYFHQFPASFLLSNLIAVPLSSIILGGELLLCLLADISYVGQLTGLVVEWMIRAMNGYIQWVEQIPGLLWQHLYWSLTETIFLLAGILAVSHWLINRSAMGRRLTLITGFALLCLQLSTQISRQEQSLLLIYNNRTHPVVDLIQGSTCQTLIDSAAIADSSIQKFLIGPAHEFFKIDKVRQSELPISFQYKGLRLIRPDKNYIAPATNDAEVSRTRVDILLITRTAPFYPGDWLKGLRIKQAVLDGSCGTRTAEEWRAALDSLHVNLYDVKVRGAFVHSFQ